MGKAKGKTKTSREFNDFAMRKPRLTVLTDEPLKLKTASDEKFNLRYKVGPVYDILRHPKIETPMAILISGKWGTGKTSAMRWLHSLLDVWNQKAKKNDIKVRPVWFYPWKYDNKEDVRRCLIAEVVINATYERDPETNKLKLTPKKLTKGLKTLGLFAAKAAVDLVSAVKIGLPGFGNVEVNAQKALEEIVKDFQEAAHPEKVYLQEYEAALKEWVKKSLGAKERMVIFIDDLDRCMPEIALQVLEALKLYLNMERLIFVVGVDKQVIEKIVVERYRKLGLVKPRDTEESVEDKGQSEQDEAEAKQYLSKMFQVEVTLDPTEQQIRDFFDKQLEKLPYWKEPYLSPAEQEVFRDLVLKFAGRNPREVKRLLNSALMSGAGVEMMKGAEETQDG